jgi:alcohol dehydrogenase class IV
VLLPHTLSALAWRFPAETTDLAAAIGGDPAEAAAQLAARAGPTTIRELGIDTDALPAIADAAAHRPELDATPPRADRAEILALYEGAY